MDKAPLVRVVGIADGRSIIVQGPSGQEIVGLLGVQELSGGEGPRHAAEALRDLALGESVYLVDHESGPRTDAAGRRVCYIYRAPEGLMLNLELIRQGYATAAADFAYQHLEAFKSHEARARAAGRGDFAVHEPADPKPDPAVAPAKPETPGSGLTKPTLPAVGVMVYITKNGQKYHLPTCRFAKGAQAVTLSEAKAKGLTPCSQCDAPK